VIRTRLYRDGKVVKENFDPAEISDHLEAKDQGCVVWLDLDVPRPEDLALIAEEFGLNPLAVEDARTERQRPKLDHYDDHVFISLYDVALAKDGTLVAHELAVFAARQYLITVRKSEGYSMEQVVARWDDNEHLAKYGVGFLLWGLVDYVVDTHFDVVQTLDTQIEALEEQLFEDNPKDDSLQRRTFELRKSLVTLRRVVLPMREVVNSLLRRDLHVITAEMVPYFQDVYDHVLRATEWTESLRDLVTTIFETHLTVRGNRLNVIMKQVTSWASIIAVPTAVTGFYGQNVPYPGFGHEWGVWASVASILLIALALYGLFKRKDWL
jgi:magnesium transporter